MATKFYFDKNGGTTGPFCFEQLARLNAQGQIGPDTRILSNNGSGEWSTWGQLAADSETRLSEVSCRQKAPGGATVYCCRAAALLFLCAGLCVTVASWSINDWLVPLVSLSFTLAGAAVLDALGSIVHWLAAIASKLPSSTP